MDLATARRLLENMVAASIRPILSADDIDDLLTQYAQIADSSRRAPSDPDWVPTFDLNRAAAVGWEWKSNRVADLYSISDNGQTLDRGKIYDHCVERSKYYAGKVRGSLVVPGRLGSG
jgi:hypothetical protein